MKDMGKVRDVVDVDVKIIRNHPENLLGMC